MKVNAGIKAADNDSSLSDKAQLISSTTPSSGTNPIMSLLNTLPLSTLSFINDLIIRVVEVEGEKAGITPIPMFVDANDTVAGLKNQIYRSFTSVYVNRPHKIRLICTNTNGGRVHVSASFPLEERPAGYASVSNDTKLKSFLLDYALVRVQILPW